MQHAIQGTEAELREAVEIFNTALRTRFPGKKRAPKANKPATMVPERNPPPED